MRRVRAAPRRGHARVLAGAALALAVLGLGSVSCAAPHEQGGPVTVASKVSVGPPAPVEPSELAASAEPAVASLPASKPRNIAIPTLEVTSEVIDLGLNPDGSMEVPPGAHQAGWYTGSPTPGETGPAVIAAHVDWDGEPGVFFQLREMKPGDEVIVTRQDGITAVFRVDRVDQYAKDLFPTEAVYGNIDRPGLRLITCGGQFNDEARSYLDNIVVYASLVGSSSA